MLRQYFRSWRGSLSLIGIGILLIQTSAAAPEEHKLNRSLAAQASITNIQWSAYDTAGKVYCGTACKYAQRSGGRKTSPSIWTWLPSGWPNATTNYSPSPATFSLVEYAPTNERTWNDDLVLYYTDYLQKSQVVLNSNDRAIRAVVQKTGNPTTQLSYHVRVQNQSSGTRDFFVRFKAPENKNFLTAAYQVGGPSGQEPVPVGDNEGKARSSADIYVDGLPVWHTANSIHLNDTVSNAYGLGLNWGEDATNDLYVVYLGRYDSAETFDMDYVVQADVETDAPDCGQDFYSYYPETTYVRYCQVMAAAREFPSASYGGASFEIFSTQKLPVTRYILKLDILSDVKRGG